MSSVEVGGVRVCCHNVGCCLNKPLIETDNLILRIFIMTDRNPNRPIQVAWLGTKGTFVFRRFSDMRKACVFASKRTKDEKVLTSLALLQFSLEHEMAEIGDVRK